MIKKIAIYTAVAVVWVFVVGSASAYVTLSTPQPFGKINFCYKGVMPTFAFTNEGEWFDYQHIKWGPDDFKMTATVLEWPGGIFGWVTNEPGICTLDEAEALGTARGAAKLNPSFAR